MNILRIVYDWPDENNATEGLAPAPYELSLAQAKLGHKIYVLCGNLNGKNLVKLRFRYELAGGNIIVYNLPRALGALGPFLTTSIKVLPYYFFLRKKIDLVHNHGQLGVWFLLYRWLIGDRDKIPVVGHFHISAKAREEILVKQGRELPFLTKYFEYPIHKFSDYLMTKVAKHMVAVSQDIIEDIKKYYGISDDRISLLESAVYTDRFKKDGESEEFGFEPGSIVVANGGRLSKRKNIDVLVESLKYLPEKYKLILWGKWDGDFQSTVSEIIKENQLNSRIRYLGSISYFEADKYYRPCNIFVLPSSYEGLPKVVLEALACGCQVLASGFRVSLPMPTLRFLKEIEAKNLAEEIMKLPINASESEYAETFQIIKTHFSWDSKAKLLDNIYQGLN